MDPHIRASCGLLQRRIIEYEYLFDETQFGDEMKRRIESRRESNAFFTQESFIRVYPAPEPDAALPDESSILSGIVDE